MKTIGIAVIGLGKWGNVLANAAKASGMIHITGGYARTPASREEFATAFNCKNYNTITELFSDPAVDAVIIASANSTHKEYAMLAAEAGKHVHLEKPMALSISDAKAIIQACKQSNVKLQIGQNYRRTPLFRFAKKIVDEKKLGLISLSRIHYSDKLGLIGGPSNPRWDPTENPGGPLYSYIIHMADVMEYLFGEVEAVSGACAKVGGPAATDDSMGALLHFKNGQLCVLSGSYISSFHVALSIEGTDAVLSLSNKNPPMLQPIEGYGGNAPVIPAESIDIGFNYIDGRSFSVREQFIDFANAIRQNSEPEVGGKEGLRALAIMRAILKSHAEKRVIKIDELLND
jgi:predicted dehydrogenase